MESIREKERQKELNEENIYINSLSLLEDFAAAAN